MRAARVVPGSGPVVTFARWVGISRQIGPPMRFTTLKGVGYQRFFRLTPAYASSDQTKASHYPLDAGFLAVFLVPLAFAPVDLAAEPFAVAFFEADALVELVFEELDFAGADFAADVFAAAALVVPDFAAPDFALEDFVVEDFVERVLLFLSPPGNAFPTAFTASVAKSPTDPATLPAVLPTFLTTLPASGIGCSPFMRPSTGRSSIRHADAVPLEREARSVHQAGHVHIGDRDR